MTPISVVIITYNEEKNLARCLESVRTVADEIVVLDSFSTDRTEAISRSFGAKFFQHEFDGHIEQKNRALSHAAYPHVLSLDADEALDEALTRSVLEVKANWRADGYSMNRLTNYCGHWVRHCGWYPDVKLRLFDRRKGKWGGLNPHDRFELAPGSQVVHLSGNILHYSYYTREDHYKQVEYFTDISSQALWKTGKKTSALKLYASPPIKFIRDYVIKLGFLDGRTGFTISRISAYATYLKYKKLRNLQARHGATNS